MSASQLADDSTLSGAGNNNNGGIAVTLQGNVGNATADKSNSQNTFGAALTAPVAKNASYANLESTVATTSGSGGAAMIGSTATILAGTNSSGSAQTVNMQWRTQTTAELASAMLLSDVVQLSGLATSGTGQTSPFVLQLDYDVNLLPGGASSEGLWASEGLIGPDWLDPATDQWTNAVNGDFGTNAGSFHLGGYPNGDLTLGDWGVNTANHTVWAVVNHDSEFAGGMAPIPEPSTLALLAVGTLCLVGYGLRLRGAVAILWLCPGSDDLSVGIRRSGRCSYKRTRGPLPLVPPRRAEPVLRVWRAMSRRNRMCDKFSMRCSYRAARLSAAGFASFAAVVLMALLPVRAANINWTLAASQSGDWSVAANWGGTLPTSSVNAWIVNGGTATITQPNETCGTLSLGSGAGSGTVQMTGGTLTTSWYQYVGYSGKGTFAQSNGFNNSQTLILGNNPGSSGTCSLSGDAVLLAYYQTVGYSGTGTFVQSGAATNTAMWLYVGTNSGASGSYSLSDNGSLHVTFGEQIGNATASGNSTGSGSFTQSGGTNMAASIACGETGSNATYTLSGSGLLLTTAEYVGQWHSATFTQSGGTNATQFTAGEGDSGILYVGYGYNGTYNLSGGSLSCANVLNVGYDANGTFNLSGGQLWADVENVGNGVAGVFTQSGGTNTASYTVYFNDGTYNLNGGRLIAPSLQSVGSAAFNFSGGTLQAGSGFSASLPMTLGTSGGGATFDTAGYDVTLSGPLSGPGSLTKVDSGTLVLAASNNYGGGTTINGGTLQLANAGALGSAGLAISAGLLDLNTYSISVPWLEGTAGTISDDSSTRTGATTLTVSQSANTAFSGTIQDGPQNLLALSKSGTGRLLLTGSNTYTGPTSINQGTLQVNGSLLSQVTINNGGILSGTGYLGSVTVTPSGQLAPGNPLGAMNVSGSLVLDFGAVMDYDLDTPSTSDEVLVPTGELILSSQQFSNFDFTWTANFGPGTYDLIAFGSRSGSLGTSTGGTIDGYAATLAVQGNEIVLTVVPEPSTLALLAAGALGLLGYRLRRRLARTPKPSTFDPHAPAILSFPSRSSVIAARRAA